MQQAAICASPRTLGPSNATDRPSKLVAQYIALHAPIAHRPGQHRCSGTVLRVISCRRKSHHRKERVCAFRVCPARRRVLRQRREATRLHAYQLATPRRRRRRVVEQIPELVASFIHAAGARGLPTLGWAASINRLSFKVGMAHIAIRPNPSVKGTCLRQAPYLER